MNIPITAVDSSTPHPEAVEDAWRRLQRNIRDLGPLSGENIVEVK